jgi:hypothetical protein
MKSEKDAQSIIEDITFAFDGVSREEGITLRETRVIDRCGSVKQRRQARAQDSETRWQDVPSADIETYSEALCFVDVKSFRYYLPAFMIWALKNLDSASFSKNAAVLALEYGAMKINDGESWPHFDLLNAEQKRAVASFLEFMAHRENESAAALNLYWGRFL